jgi:hypothetical protein
MDYMFWKILNLHILFLKKPQKMITLKVHTVSYGNIYIYKNKVP